MFIWKTCSRLVNDVIKLLFRRALLPEMSLLMAVSAVLVLLVGPVPCAAVPISESMTVLRVNWCKRAWITSVGVSLVAPPSFRTWKVSFFGRCWSGGPPFFLSFTLGFFLLPLSLLKHLGEVGVIVFAGLASCHFVCGLPIVFFGDLHDEQPVSKLFFGLSHPLESRVELCQRSFGGDSCSGGDQQQDGILEGLNSPLDCC